VEPTAGHTLFLATGSGYAANKRCYLRVMYRLNLTKGGLSFLDFAANGQLLTVLRGSRLLIIGRKLFRKNMALLLEQLYPGFFNP
jgi:hypothetical protein